MFSAYILLICVETQTQYIVLQFEHWPLGDLPQNLYRIYSVLVALFHSQYGVPTCILATLAPINNSFR